VLGGGLLVHQPQLKEAVRRVLAGDGLTDLRRLNRDPAYGALFLAQQLSRPKPTSPVVGLSDLGERLLGEDTHVAELAQRSADGIGAYAVPDAPRGLRKVTETL
jgi:hypothetical protein